MVSAVGGYTLYTNIIPIGRKKPMGIFLYYSLLFRNSDYNLHGCFAVEVDIFIGFKIVPERKYL